MAIKVKTKKVVKKEIEHCCESMDYFLEEKKVSIYYNPIYREYFIGLKSPRNGKLVIYNCPWCGFEFKESLVDEYHEILESEFKIYRNTETGTYYEINVDSKGKSNEFYVDLPFDFTTDYWWKRRGF